MLLGEFCAPCRRLPSGELKAAVGAGAFDEGQRAPTRGARRLVTVGDGGRGRQLDALARELVVPIAVDQHSESGKVGLLDQEVRSSPSTTAAAGWAADVSVDAGLAASLAHPLHVGDRACHRGNQLHVSTVHPTRWPVTSSISVARAMDARWSSPRRRGHRSSAASSRPRIAGSNRRRTNARHSREIRFASR